jgi:uncharacterized repeat protein (TIGR04076 family)
MIRREFCKRLPCAAIALGSLGALGMIHRKDDEIGKEANMAKKVKAVTVKVLDIKGTCSQHKVGDIATITESGVEGKICIHALYSLLPGAFAMLFDVEFPWLADKDVKTHACPDAANPAVFEIRKVREA